MRNAGRAKKSAVKRSKPQWPWTIRIRVVRATPYSQSSLIRRRVAFTSSMLQSPRSPVVPAVSCSPTSANRGNGTSFSFADSPSMRRMERLKHVCLRSHRRVYPDLRRCIKRGPETFNRMRSELRAQWQVRVQRLSFTFCNDEPVNYSSHPQATTSLARGNERVDYWPLHSGV